MAATATHGRSPRLISPRATTCRSSSSCARKQEEIAALEEQIAALDATAVDVQPLLQRMFDDLVQFVASDVPFFKAERDERMARLGELMANVEATASEKFRRIVEAYQIELEYGRTMSSYKQTLADGREAEMVRLGRVSLMYRTVEGAETGYWDNESKQWVPDPARPAQSKTRWASPRKSELRISSSCPCRRRKEADRELRFEEPAGALYRGVGDRVSADGRVGRGHNSSNRRSRRATDGATDGASASSCASGGAVDRDSSSCATGFVIRSANSPRNASSVSARSCNASNVRHKKPWRAATRPRRAATRSIGSGTRTSDASPKPELLTESQGNLGELFGVTRQVAGDAATVMQASVLSTQYGVPTEGEERAEFLRRLAGARALPSIVELERLWYEMVREMTDGGKVVKFRTRRCAARRREHAGRREQGSGRKGRRTRRSVHGQRQRQVPRLSAEPEVADGVARRARRRAPGSRPQPASAAPDSGYQRAVVDPASGALLSLYVERPNSVRSASRTAKSSAT